MASLRYDFENSICHILDITPGDYVVIVPIWVQAIPTSKNTRTAVVLV